jgi:hypothetical protein
MRTTWNVDDEVVEEIKEYARAYHTGWQSCDYPAETGVA